jgi:hypothetical protein
MTPWIAGWFLGSAVVALLLALPGRRRIPTGVLVGASVLSAAVVFFSLADFRILGNLAYVFMLKFGAINWTVLNQLFAVVLGRPHGRVGGHLSAPHVRRVHPLRPVRFRRRLDLAGVCRPVGQAGRVHGRRRPTALRQHPVGLGRSSALD